MSFARPSCPLHVEGLIIAEMVATLENQLAHAKRKADDTINEKNMLTDEVRHLKQNLMEETLKRFDLQTQLEKAKQDQDQEEKSKRKKLDRGVKKPGLSSDLKADNNEKVKFTIITEEVCRNGALTEDLECGIKPKTTCEQVKKSYCKIMGLESKEIILMMGGKCLRMGQTFRGLGGATVIARRVGEGGFGGAGDGLEESESEPASSYEVEKQSEEGISVSSCRLLFGTGSWSGYKGELATCRKEVFNECKE